MFEQERLPKMIIFARKYAHKEEPNAVVIVQAQYVAVMLQANNTRNRKKETQQIDPTQKVKEDCEFNSKN